MDKDTLGAMLISLHEHFKMRATDWLLAAMLFSWGLALFVVNPEVWALPTFSGLNRLAPQAAWATATTTIGAARIAALFINGAVRRSPHCRLVGAFLSIFVWVQLSMGVFNSSLVGPGIALFPWLALADMFNVYRAASDAYASDHRASERRSLAARRAPTT